MSAGKNMALIGGGALCALLAAARGEVYAANIYVNSSVDADGDGQSWATAKKSIQAGIDSAGEFDAVLIAAGTLKKGKKRK